MILFYDRRKNYYKNEGRPLAKIVGIPYLAQALMAIALRRPDNARARPSSLLKTDEQYAKVFSDKYPLELYLVCAQIVRRTDDYLYKQEWLDRKDLNNIKFYVAMVASMVLTGLPQPKVVQLSLIKAELITTEVLRVALEEVYGTYRNLGSSDQVAKGPELTRNLVSSRTDAYVAAKKSKFANGSKPKKTA